MRGIATAKRATYQFGDAYVVEDQSLFSVVSSVFTSVIPLVSYN